MSEQTFKELLEPPFEVEIYEDDGFYFVSDNFFKDNKDNYSKRRRWLMALSPFYIGNENLSKEFIKWAATALNEKWERDLGKPARWNFSSLTDEIDCPYCGHLWFVYEDGFKWETWNYCPHCGKRLLPPEEINNE